MRGVPYLSVNRLGLRAALLAYAVLPLVGVLGLVGYLGLRAQEEWIEERLQEDVELIARAIREPLAGAVEEGRDGPLAQAMESASQIDRVYGVYVYDVEGRPIAVEGSRQPTEARSRVTQLAVAGDRRGEYGSVEGREVYSYFVPLIGSGGRSVGLLQVTRRRSDFDRYIARARVRGALFLVAAAAVMAAVVLYGHHGAVGRHLHRLAETMSRVGSGERTHRASTRGPREMAAVGAELNAMLDNLAAAEREVERQRAEQRALEGQLRHSEKLAAIGQLAAGVAHELGTPLSVIYGKAQRLLRGADASGESARAVRSIRREVQRMERIVRQLLGFARADRIERRAVALGGVAAAAADAVRPACEAAGTTLECLGPEPGPVIRGDAARLEQVAVNLLRNAADASPGGRIRLTWSAAAGEVRLTVEDDGPGVDPEVRPRLFDPFFTTKPVGRGTGLGLAVAHGIVQEHGGRIEVVRSELGGAAFTLFFPTDPSDAE